MTYKEQEKLAGLYPIPIPVRFLLWVGFTLVKRSTKAYGRWKQERIHLALNSLPPSDQWFTPILRLYINFKFWYQTGKSQSWLETLFAALCEEEGYARDFRKVARVGLVKISPGYVHVKDTLERWEFTMNESWPGKLYIHARTTGDWKLIYRKDWFFKNFDYMPILEELWNQIQKVPARYPQNTPINSSGTGKNPITSL